MVTDNTTLTGNVALTSQDAEVFSDNTTYYFDILEEHTISIQNQITDNWVENNTSVQDQIAQSPIIITLKGYIGELVWNGSTDDQYTDLLKQAALETTPTKLQKLSTLSVLVPQVDNITQLAKNAWTLGTNAVQNFKSIKSVWQNKNNPPLPSNSPAQPYQEPRLYNVFRKLSLLRLQNKSFIVETPFKETGFQDMYILSMTFHQGNENYKGDIEITLKQINFTEVATTKANEKVMSQYNAWARATEENNGKAGGVRINSLSYDFLTPNIQYNNR